MPLCYSKPLAIVDLETTGGSAAYHRVIEIGIIRIEPDGATSTFHTLINPERPVSPFITEITGIQREWLERAPTFDSIASEVLKFCEHSIFVAHNARFDYSFLKQEFRKLRMPFQMKTLCSVKLSRKLYPEYRKHDLSSLIERFGIPIANRHRALDDAKAVQLFLEQVIEQKGADALYQCMNLLTQNRLIQSSVPLEELEAITEGHGVYIFYGENNEILYVGKSVNLRERVLSHFYSDLSSAKELNLTQKIHRIETIPTPGELSSLLLESRLVKELMPIFNQKLRRKKVFLVARQSETSDGYHQAHLASVSDIPEHEASSILGTYRSQRQAKKLFAELAQQHQLCPKLLSLESGQGACFSYHLKACKGACRGEEKPQVYNLRFALAFSASRLRRWPYKGPILIDERNDEENRGQGFVVHDWRVLAHLRYESDDMQVNYVNQPFDWDSYSILTKKLLQSSRYLRIHPLPANRPLPEALERFVGSN